jgi:sugar (pentulose or hexulose) kinase
MDKLPPAPLEETPAIPSQESPRTLVIDIGGTGIKAMLLNDSRRPLGQRKRRETPSSGKPGEVMDVWWNSKSGLSRSIVSRSVSLA